MAAKRSKSKANGEPARFAIWVSKSGKMTLDECPDGLPPGTIYFVREHETEWTKADEVAAVAEPVRVRPETFDFDAEAN